MLEQIICFIISGLGSSNYFEKIFPLVELIQKDKGYRPAEYVGKGQFKDVTLFDHYNGMAYFRQTGGKRISKLDPKEGEVACQTYLQIEYPLRLVACIPKSKLSNDDAFSDDRIATTIGALLTSENGLINGQLKASYVSVIPTDVISSNKDVLDQEYPGLEIKDVNYAFAYLAVDFLVTVQIKASCINSECINGY